MNSLLERVGAIVQSCTVACIANAKHGTCATWHANPYSSALTTEDRYHCVLTVPAPLHNSIGLSVEIPTGCLTWHAFKSNNNSNTSRMPTPVLECCQRANRTDGFIVARLLH